MKRNEHTSSSAVSTTDDIQNGDEYITVDQLRSLVCLLEQNDVTEIEMKHHGKRTHLLMRKSGSQIERIATNEASPVVEQATFSSPDTQNHYTITSPMVGIFQGWSIAKDQPPVAVGDMLQEGRHIGIICALNIRHEVEAPVTGHVIDLLVEDNQCVEYGQPLMIVDLSVNA